MSLTNFEELVHFRSSVLLRTWVGYFTSCCRLFSCNRVRNSSGTCLCWALCLWRSVCESISGRFIFPKSIIFWSGVCQWSLHRQFLFYTLLIDMWSIVAEDCDLKSIWTTIVSSSVDTVSWLGFRSLSKEISAPPLLLRSFLNSLFWISDYTFALHCAIKMSLNLTYNVIVSS